ncbi:MAG: PilZ domain-containing protein [Elusimicrobia bacterium]|nr:PilZ domain-containing protein [Elusimicrobiota bacterium]
MDDVKEKRKYIRVPIYIEIYIEESNYKNRQTGKRDICFYTSDISVGGISLASPVTFDVGSEISTRFKLPNAEKPIHLVGKIVRQQFNGDNYVEGIGVEFNGVGFEDKKLIEEYVKIVEDYVVQI